jgi:septum formation protein
MPCDMLRLLSGRTHEVLTAVRVTPRGFESARQPQRGHISRHQRAGGARLLGYGRALRQGGRLRHPGHGAVFVADLRGSYSGVMGLPLYETADLLGKAGVPRWRLAERG